MSTHVIETDHIRWLFGWNERYVSYFLTKLDKTLGDEQNPVLQLGNRPREIPTPEGLFALALMAGLDIPSDLRYQVYHEKDLGSRVYFVLFYPNEFVHGFRADSMGHAEDVKKALTPARPGVELQIRRVKKEGGS